MGDAGVEVGPEPLTFEQVVAVARDGARVALSDGALKLIGEAHAHIEELSARPTPVYGVSTGFGALATRHIAPEMRAQLQLNIVRSHAAGSGPEVEREVVRALMLLRLRTLATGRTGVQPTTARTLAELLNAGITPQVFEYGSLGCSGDLAPLAHVALALIGEGSVRDTGGDLKPAAEALSEAGIAPVMLGAKEGLALLNGTDGMLGMLVLAIHDLRRLLVAADVAAAMTVEALLGTDRVFAADLQALRPHPGQAASAANLRALLDASEIMESHRGPDCTRVQDAYSLRCAPQVNGAARDTLAHAELVAAGSWRPRSTTPSCCRTAASSRTGTSTGRPSPTCSTSSRCPAADVASMSERRTDRMLDRGRSGGLPAFLADDPGVDSGHMIAQYTQAGIVSELKRLAAPASADSIPSSAMQEDHVSMGWTAARKLRRAVDGLAQVVAIEILTAARALDLRTPLRPGPATAAVVAKLREAVPPPGPDRYLAPEIAAATALVRDGSLVAAAEAVTGPLS
ncbi:histidine ammonia-lyase [Actinomadura madurae]|uniref:histidine ammonia-lyase n=1 Tax=Actinomadura madurae TaxID=1993 RepID=UPI0020D20EBB|nr:histidine ammonia-lyase [Actinomadura madurae]MCP9971005.1 histidine ammonia-lyase [Actinomadura madurae]